MNEGIKVSFVVRKDCTNESECSEDMQIAFVTCEQHRGSGLQPQWVNEKDIVNLEGLTKKDVFVLNEFAGEIFEKLRATKCLLVGPRCLSCCLTEGSTIPLGPESVFTIAMRGLVVTASGLSKLQKETIKRKVQWMGGIYSSLLTDNTTHLVSDTVLSDKYIKSVEKGIPIMSESWVEAVWQVSLQLNVNGSSPQFKDHLLPPFANLQVTTSGISKRDKTMIMKLVNENGGAFSGTFQSESTDVVVLNKDGAGSEKYKAALEYGKACVLPSWVKDSAARGVALPLDKYKVAGASTSSPLAEHRLPDMSLNFSRITNLRVPTNFVDETRSADVSTVSCKMKLSQDKRKSSEGIDKEIAAAFENFDMTKVKKAGPIFDGFGILVAGPESSWRDRALALVSRCGAIRYSEPHDRVTHVVTAVMEEVTAVNAHVVSPRWLIDSVEAGRALDEVDYQIKPKESVKSPSSTRKKIEPASPMSKRNLQLLRRPPPPLFLQPEKEVEKETPGEDIVNHYLSQQPLEPEREKTPEPVKVTSHVTSNVNNDITDDCDEPTDEVEQIFRDIRMEVQGLEEEAICEIGAEVSAAGGCLVAAGAGGSHALVPLDFDPNDLVNKSAEPVTVFWVKDCLSQQELLPIEYYHRPVCLPQWGPEGPPLQGVVASLSTYSGVERAFLDELAKLLGATTQLRFCRRTTASALASTHLICPTAVGDKYLGALKWGVPAVSAGWLRDCAAEGRRVREGPYLIGETKEPEMQRAEATSDEQTVGQADRLAEEMPNKENAMLPPADSTTAPRRSSLTSTQQTPRGKGVEAESEMSPASRYIAMARLGLLGGDSQGTPAGQPDHEGEVRTPPLDDALSTPNLRGLSPTTRRRLQAVKRGEMPSDPIKTPVNPFEKQAETPDSAFGAGLVPGSGRLSPRDRKTFWRIVQELPSGNVNENTAKTTPLSEIRNRFLAQFNSDAPTPPSDHQLVPRKLYLQDQADTPPAKVARTSIIQSPGSTTTPKSAEASTKSASSDNSTLPAAVEAQLQRLSAALSGRGSPANRSRRIRESIMPVATGPESEPCPESQPNTVGWDDTTPAANDAPAIHTQTNAIKRFMLSSNVDNRDELISMIQYLGGEVSDGSELDPDATHLLCSAPGRSEKMLGSIAHGKWVLHPAYVARSRANGAFVDEELFEWGNDKAVCLPALPPNEHVLAAAAHRWRKAREEKSPGPFSGVVALLHVPPDRKRLLARLVTAGDGIVVEQDPPYSDDRVTVCFADLKRCPLNDEDATWLRSRRTAVCAPVLLSAFLTDSRRPDVTRHCLPEFRAG